MRCDDEQCVQDWVLPGHADPEPLIRGVPDIGDLLGLRYVPYGRDPMKGLSCMGLVMEIYRRAGIAMADPARDHEGAAVEWDEITLEEPWPVLAVLGIRAMNSDMVGHVAVYLGGGLAIHSVPKRGVEVVSVNRLPRPVIAVYRYRKPKDAANNGA